MPGPIRGVVTRHCPVKNASIDQRPQIVPAGEVCRPLPIQSSASKSRSCGESQAIVTQRGSAANQSRSLVCVRFAHDCPLEPAQAGPHCGLDEGIALQRSKSCTSRYSTCLPSSLTMPILISSQSMKSVNSISKNISITPSIGGHVLDPTAVRTSSRK